MARTKQTARESTGDTAPRGKLRPRGEATTLRSLPEENEEATSAGTKRKKSATAKPPAAKRAKTQVTPGRPGDKATKTTKAARVPNLSEHAAEVVKRVEQAVALGPIQVTDFSNSFCYICQNGGPSVACDECPRIVCLKHIPQIDAIPEATRKNLHFRCPSCHTRATQNYPEGAPYFGIYDVDQDGNPAKPYLPHWTTVIVHAARPQHVQVDTRPLLILSIRLVSLDEDSCPARFLYHYLVPWFDGPANTHLRYIDMPYSILDTEDADRYLAQWDEALTALGPLTQTRIILFIYTHSHDETGDLFYAPKESSEDLTEWWNYLICTKLKHIATTPTNDLTVAVLACGAVIRNERPREQLVAAATELGAKRMFTFAATHLQAVLTVPFFMNFAQRVYLEKTDLHDSNIGTVLDQSLFLARHTPIWYFSRATLKNAFTIRIFEWSHLTMRPHGEDLGLQCPGCGSLSSRKGKLLHNQSKQGRQSNGPLKSDKSKKARLDESNDTSHADVQPIFVSCQNPACQWSKVFYPPATGIRKLTLGEKGQWRSRTVLLKSTEDSVTLTSNM